VRATPRTRSLTDSTRGSGGFCGTTVGATGMGGAGSGLRAGTGSARSGATSGGSPKSNVP
jgi:hypothetical protein